MAAYRQVYDSHHLQADCQEPGSAPEPHARHSSMGYLYFYMSSYISVSSIHQSSFSNTTDCCCHLDLDLVDSAAILKIQKSPHLTDNLTTRSESYASTPPLSFLQAGCPSCRPTNSVKALKAIENEMKINKIQ